MPLPRYTALEFRRPMERGLTDPFLVIAEPVGGGSLEALVVKSRAGYRNRPEAMLREVFEEP